MYTCIVLILILVKEMELRSKLSKAQSNLPAVEMSSPPPLQKKPTSLTNIFSAHKLQVIVITGLLGQSIPINFFSLAEFL